MAQSCMSYEGSLSLSLSHTHTRTHTHTFALSPSLSLLLTVCLSLARPLFPSLSSSLHLSFFLSLSISPSLPPFLSLSLSRARSLSLALCIYHKCAVSGSTLKSWLKFAKMTASSEICDGGPSIWCGGWSRVYRACIVLVTVRQLTSCHTYECARTLALSPFRSLSLSLSLPVALSPFHSLSLSLSLPFALSLSRCLSQRIEWVMIWCASTPWHCTEISSVCLSLWSLDSFLARKVQQRVPPALRW